jgi:hypothetical protein
MEIACDEMERLIHAYIGRVGIFSRAVEQNPENFSTWYAIVEKADGECRHAYKAMKKHMYDHRCCDLPLVPYPG